MSEETTTKLNINQWAEEDRPREKLMTLGAETLSNAELLAILIGSGSTKETAVELMKRILVNCHNNLNTLGKMSIRDLCQYNGIGEAKAITILAACELGKRRVREKAEERPQLSTATDIYNYMYTRTQDLDVEEAWTPDCNTCFYHDYCVDDDRPLTYVLTYAINKEVTFAHKILDYVEKEGVCEIIC